jgi:hypothetical protein
MQIHTLPQTTLYVETPAVTVAPGPYTLAVEFDAAGGRVAGYERDSFTVPDFTRGGLQISDLLLALHVEEVEEGAASTASPHLLRRRGYEVVPAPWAVFGRGQPLYLYFEAYGLETNAGGSARYEVEAMLVPADERGRLRRLWDDVRRARPERGVSVAVESSGRGSDQGQYLILDLADQKPGEYVLALRVRQGERVVEAERGVELE